MGWVSAELYFPFIPHNSSCLQLFVFLQHNKRAAIVKYIQELESQIQQQQNVYNDLAEKFTKLQQKPESKIE